MTADTADLSRRERQIMGIVYEHGRVTAAEVRERMPDAPSNSAVRAMLRILEDKGHLRHEQDGPRYVFMPTVPREEASETARVVFRYSPFWMELSERRSTASVPLRRLRSHSATGAGHRLVP